MIYFFSEDIDFTLSNELLIARWLTDVALTEHFTIDELSYIFCTDEYLLTLNQQYLHHDYFTDVITFDHRELATEEILGDVFISYERVADNSAQFNLSITEEINRVMLHGLLHLLGYDDATPTEKNNMRDLEDRYLNELRENQMTR